MSQWLLLEVLGKQPVVVAQGHVLRRFVPLHVFLRRSPQLAEIEATVAQTVQSRQAVTATASGGRSFIHTKVVAMNDGPVHGVQVWSGSPRVRPAQRPLPGAVVWNLTTATASDTPQALLNSGFNLDGEETERRPFAADLPIGEINQDETAVLARSMTCKPGDTFASTWNATSHDDKPIRVSFVARALLEQQNDGTDHLVCRAMNWRVPIDPARSPSVDLAQQILKGTAQVGIHRALIDLKSWNLLKWIDPPFPHIDWRGEVIAQPFVHPDDRPMLGLMTQQFSKGPAVGLLRLRGAKGAWTLVHTTVHRVHLVDDSYAGLVAIRLPTPAELRRGL